MADIVRWTAIPPEGDSLATDDDERFAELFRAHYRRAYAFAARRVGRDRADDIAAETFAVAWRRLDAVPSDAVPWLLTTARNFCRNELRRQGRAHAAGSRLLSETQVSSAPGSPAELDPAMVRALDELSPPDRELILLVAWEELTQREIAAVLGTTRTNVALRLFRARRRIAASLARDVPKATTELDEGVNVAP